MSFITSFCASAEGIERIDFMRVEVIEFFGVRDGEDEFVEMTENRCQKCLKDLL
jgi:hypothetical protein